MWHIGVDVYLKSCPIMGIMLNSGCTPPRSPPDSGALQEPWKVQKQHARGDPQALRTTSISEKNTP